MNFVVKNWIKIFVFKKIRIKKVAVILYTITYLVDRHLETVGAQKKN